jgi:hypothetical protein
MLILLDIDGVMLPAASWRTTENLSDGFPGFTKHAVKNLKKLLSETHASIVLISTHKTRFSNSEWRNIFRNRGIEATIDVLENENDSNRKDEIVNWYNTHSNEDFIIIDDDKSLNDLPERIKHNLVQTKSLVGFNEESYNVAKNIIRDAHPA